MILNDLEQTFSHRVKETVSFGYLAVFKDLEISDLLCQFVSGQDKDERPPPGE